MKAVILGLLAWAAVISSAAAQAPVPTIRMVDEALGLRAAVRYYDQYWAPLADGPAGAHCFDQFVRIDSAGLNWRSRRYVLATRRLILEQYFTGEVPGTELEGPSREWYENGQLREELVYHKSRVVGVLRTYFSDGKLRRTEYAPPAKGPSVCLDSAGRPLPKCPEYHTFAQLKGRNTYSGKFLKLVQQQYAHFLPTTYRQPTALLVYYCFRIDSLGAVRNARVITSAPPELQDAVIQSIRQLPAFTPATLEGQLTNDVVEGAVQAAAVVR